MVGGRMEYFVYVVPAVVIALFFFKLRKPNKSERSPTPKRYAAVMIDHQDFPCSAAFDRSTQLYLACEAPKLPLETCDRPEKCRCKYVHFDDRRQKEDDRRVSSPLLRDSYIGDEKRTPRKRGRRFDD